MVYVPGIALIIPLEVRGVWFPSGSVKLTFAAVDAGKSVIVITSAVGVATIIWMLDDFVASSDDVAVIFADPEDVGANTPEESIVPPVAVHITAELKFPVP
jgi:hypothetical protein